MKNIKARWFWIAFLGTGAFLNLNIENSFISLVVTIFNLTFLIIAIKKTFFGKKEITQEK